MININKILKEAIEKPELWDKFHEKSIIHHIVF